MPSRLQVILVIGALAGAAAAFLTFTNQGPSQGLGSGLQVSSGKAAIGGPFSLVDASGKRRTQEDFLGRPMLIFFGFTHCPDVCPSGLQTLTVALDELGAKSQELAAVFVSVDPERDSPDVMASYLKSFHKDIVGLTGTADEVQAAIKTFRVYAKKVPSETNASDYTVDHSAFLYLMDRNGEYKKHFPHSIDAAKLAVELRAAL